MTHERFSDQGWELEDDRLDVRGWPVVDESGQELGVVEDLLVDIQTETIDSVVLDRGGELSLAGIEIGDGELRVGVAAGLGGSMAGGSPGTTSGSTGMSGTTDGATTGSGMPGAAMSDAERDTWRIRRHEEQLGARTRRAEAGEVRVGKQVHEETRAIDVPVTHEEVEIRRVATDRPADGAGIVDTGDTIRVPVTAETVEVVKEPRVVEELEISKRPVTTTQRVEDTVRREEIDIEETGDVRRADGGQQGVGHSHDDR